MKLLFAWCIALVSAAGLRAGTRKEAQGLKHAGEVLGEVNKPLAADVLTEKLTQYGGSGPAK